MLLEILIICGIMFILALIYIIGCLAEKHMQSMQKKYQEHIDDLVEELFPPATPAIPTPAVNTYTPTPNESSDTYDPQYREAKRKMVADIRTYFNQRKINAAIRDAENKTGLPMSSPIFSTGPDTSSLPTPPSIQMLLE